MYRFSFSGFCALCVALLAGVSASPASAQTTDEKPRPATPPVQFEDVRPPSLNDPSAWSISGDARTAIAEALKAGDYGLVENQLVKLIEQNPKSSQLLTFLARIFFMDNKPLNCAVALKKAERLEPLGESDQYTLALSYVNLRKSDWASKEFERLAQSYPQNALYPYWQGRLAYDSYSYAAAVEKFNKALELDPEFARAYDNLGLCYEMMSNNDLALKNYERAVNLNRKKTPASPWPPLNYGMLLLKQGSIEQAEPPLREAVTLGPKLSQTHHQLGIVLAKQKKFPEAIEELTRANEVDPTYPESHLTLAHVYRQMGEPEKAAAELDAFQELKQAQKDREKTAGSAPANEKQQ